MCEWIVNDLGTSRPNVCVTSRVQHKLTFAAQKPIHNSAHMQAYMEHTHQASCPRRIACRLSIESSRMVQDIDSLLSRNTSVHDAVITEGVMDAVSVTNVTVVADTGGRAAVAPTNAVTLAVPDVANVDSAGTLVSNS